MFPRDQLFCDKGKLWCNEKSLVLQIIVYFYFWENWSTCKVLESRFDAKNRYVVQKYLLSWKLLSKVCFNVEASLIFILTGLFLSLYILSTNAESHADEACIVPQFLRTIVLPTTTGQTPRKTFITHDHVLMKQSAKQKKGLNTINWMILKKWSVVIRFLSTHQIS